MSFPELLGRSVTRTVRRIDPAGLVLGADDDETIMLARSHAPPDVKVDDDLEVFVYGSEEGQWLATTRKPRLELGEVAFLTVTDCTPIGAFVDWGLGKELLVPFAEQTTTLCTGNRHPIGLYIDKSERLAGTMRISEFVTCERADFELDEWVDGEAWRHDPSIGLFVIVERAFTGLVPASEPQRLSRGESARFRITNVLADGKIELSLRRHAHEELEDDARQVLEKLSRPRAPRVGDRSSPEEIRAIFGLSKKAFKRAIGRLLRERAVEIDPDGFITSAQ